MGCVETSSRYATCSPFGIGPVELSGSSETILSGKRVADSRELNSQNVPYSGFVNHLSNDPGQFSLGLFR